MATTQARTTAGNARIRSLRESDLPAADRVMRLAFGTFLGMPEPAQFMGDADYVSTRWRANPDTAFAAEIDDELIGSNFVTSWGSVGFFGPLTIRPDHWDKGVGKLLMEPVMGLFTDWKTKHAGLFTFANSPKHIGLYNKYGFRPRFLTAIMSKGIEPLTSSGGWTRFSKTSRNDEDAVLEACRDLTNDIYDGLNVEHEIRAVRGQELGDTVLLWDDSRLAGLAVCHMGAGTEAGTGTCYVKFAAARPGPNAERDFARLLDACESMSSAGNLSRLAAGVNTARYEAYSRMLARGFRTDLQGVSMAKSDDAGYNRPEVYVIDDWR